VIVAIGSTSRTASASCDSGAPPSYDDVSYIRIAIYSLVGQLHPWFTYEGSFERSLGALGDPNRDHADVTLVARRATKFSGQFEADDPISSFRGLVDVLSRDDFFNMRLHRASGYYLDGPEDEILVARCGVETILTTLPYGSAADLDDNQGRALFRLERDLQDAVFAQKWRTPKDGVRAFSKAPP